MNVTIIKRQSTSTIRLDGRFDFSVHRPFRDAVKTALEARDTREIEVDLAGVNYMDSSALGMLLLSRENAAAVGKTIILLRPSEGIRQILDIANFHKLFTIR